MKKIISLTLAALMLVTLLLTVTSCEVSMEGTTGYTRLRDHVIDTVGQNNELALDGSAMGFSAVRLVAPIKKSETKVNEVYLVADGGSQNALFRLTLKLTDSTEKNLTMRVEAENGATAGKFELAKAAKELNLDAIHDTVHEMARDEARHGKAFAGLLARYFG